jgi:putative ABC transport system permease protein
MPLLSRMTSFLRNTLGKHRNDQELDAEVREYAEMLAEEKIRQGVTAEEARRSAQIELGGIEQVKEQVREARAGAWLDSLFQDLRYGARMLRKNPGFTAIAVLTLALGIGANTAIFSFVSAVLLRPLPYPQPQKIVILGIVYGNGDFNDTVESQQYVYWRDHSQSLDAPAAISGSMGGFNLVANGTPVHVRGSKFTRQFFSVLGVQPMLGRGFSEEEDRPGGPSVVVLSYGLWRTAFGGDPHVIGRSATLNGVPYSIVGVLPQEFRFDTGDEFDSNPEVLIPLQLSSEPRDRGTNYEFIARLKPSVTFAAAQADADRVSGDFARAYPDYYQPRDAFHMRLSPLQQALVGDVKPILLVLLGAVGFVLLIACVNVANLFLSRATARRREMAIRATLGATAGRLFRQLLCESLLLAILAGAAGLLLAVWGVSALVANSPAELPRIGELSFDWRVLLFTLGISALVAVVCGSVGAFHALGADVNESLKEGGERVGGVPGRRLSRFLLAGEVALSLVLLVGAGLLILTVVHLSRVPLGFDSKNLLSARMSLTSEKYNRNAQVWNFQRQVIDRVRQLPGVSSVASASATPLERGLTTVVFRRGAYTDDQHDMLSIQFRSISPEYFRTLAIPLLSGREFADADSADSARVVVVNQSLAAALWPGENPTGKMLLAGEGSSKQNKPREVVGIVADIKEIGLDQPPRATIYVPQPQVLDAFNAMTNYWFASSLLVRTAGPVDVSAEISKIVAEVDPEEPVARFDTMNSVKARSIAEQRFLMTLMGVFAALALVLAAVGIYGVLSYQMSRRTREIGIRMALGASPRSVLRLILREVLLIVFAGIAVGVGAAFGLTRFLASELFGVRPADPLTFFAVAVLLICVALFACYVPARRAMYVDPMVALRYE